MTTNKDRNGTGYRRTILVLALTAAFGTAQAADEKSAQEKPAQEKASEEKAAQAKAAEEKAEKEKLAALINPNAAEIPSP